MDIFVNGQSHAVPDECTAAQLLETLDITARRIAVEVNREIVPRSSYPTHFLRAGDQVEIVHAIGGG
jgi:thiamine biosynthesis protein ThiS